MMYDPSIQLSFIPNASPAVGGSTSYSIGCHSGSTHTHTQDFSFLSKHLHFVKWRRDFIKLSAVTVNVLV